MEELKSFLPVLTFIIIILASIKKITVYESFYQEPAIRLRILRDREKRNYQYPQKFIPTWPKFIQA